MNWEDVLQFVCVILTGVATAIPLVLKLVEYVRKAALERNWAKMLELVLGLMESAEGLFEEGAQRKAYVMTAVGNLSETVGYEMDTEALGELIDRLCDMSAR